jgi:hypothetical protein
VFGNNIETWNFAVAGIGDPGREEPWQTPRRSGIIDAGYNLHV